VCFNWVSRLSNINANHISNVNYIGNYLKPGSNTHTSAGSINQVQRPAAPVIYTANNYHSTLHTTPVLDDQDLWSVKGSSSSLNKSYFTQNQHSLIGESFPIKTAAETYTDVLGDVGANKYLNTDGTYGTYIDTYDATKISNVVNNISTDPYDKSYILPTLPNNSRPASYDTDNDGMADLWETNTFGDLSKDGKRDHDYDGYTDLEEFLNQVDNTDNATDISSLTKEEFSIFPNPASSELNIRTSGNENHLISICNSLGQEVFFSQMNKSSYTIDIQSWESGLYVVILRDKNFNIKGRQKLIVK
jgi:hypothetical protein